MTCSNCLKKPALDPNQRRRDLASTDRPLTRLERSELRRLTTTLDGAMPRLSRRRDHQAALLVKKMLKGS